MLTESKTGRARAPLHFSCKPVCRQQNWPWHQVRQTERAPGCMAWHGRAVAQGAVQHGSDGRMAPRGAKQGTCPLPCPPSRVSGRRREWFRFCELIWENALLVLIISVYLNRKEQGGNKQRIRVDSWLRDYGVGRCARAPPSASLKDCVPRGVLRDGQAGSTSLVRNSHAVVINSQLSNKKRSPLDKSQAGREAGRYWPSLMRDCKVLVRALRRYPPGRADQHD